ncbi:MAG TPA: hypothetical protein VGJ13_05045 [Pseudonocardiaceae bacterium]|jgi:hypothetical protein
MRTPIELACDRDPDPGPAVESLAVEDMSVVDLRARIHAVEQEQQDLHHRMKPLLRQVQDTLFELHVLRAELGSRDQL